MKSTEDKHKNDYFPLFLGAALFVYGTFLVETDRIANLCFCIGLCCIVSFIVDTAVHNINKNIDEQGSKTIKFNKWEF